MVTPTVTPCAPDAVRDTPPVGATRSTTQRLATFIAPYHIVWYGHDMTALPAPAWPVLVLAAISAVDGALCLGPVAFIAECFSDVGFPRRYWPLMPIIKFAAAGGLVAGVWIPVLGSLTTASLVLYFLVAIAMHVRMRDFGRNLFLNATGMLGICTATLAFCFLV